MRRLLIALLVLVLPTHAIAQTAKQIVQYPAAGAISSSDRLLLQQGGIGTPFTHGTVSQMLTGGLPAAFSTLATSAAATVGGTLGVTGAATLSSTLGVTGAATLSSTLGVTGTITGSGSIIAGNGGSAPITLQSGIISVPASQSLSVRTSTALQTITFGAPTAGLGSALAVTPNSNGNSLFGAAPNTVSVTNLFTAGRIATTGGTYALSGTVTPTAFSGTGATATATFATITGIVIPVGSTITITGATPAGYNTTAATVTASTSTTVSWASTATGALSVAGSLAYNIASPRIVNMQSNWTGVPAAGTQWYPYIFGVPTDEADTGATGFGAPVFLISHNFGGNAKGAKNGIRVLTTQTSATNDPVVPGVINQQHGAAEFWGQTAYNAGGTGNNSNAAGSFYGTNPQILLQPGATYWRLANAMGEVNLAVYASSRTITLGGTVTAGDVLSVTFASSDIVGTPVTVSWTTGASQTLTMVANNLASAINSNTALANAKISASSAAGVVTLYWYTHIATLTTTVGTSGGATTTLTLGGVTSGASVDIKLMGSMVRLAEDTAPGSLNSAFLLFTAQPGSGRSGLFNYGLVFGGIQDYSGEWSWHRGSTLIGANQSSSYGGAGKSAPLVPNWAKYGIDFSRVAVAGNGGASLLLPGFKVASDTTGAVYVGGYKIAAASGVLAIDTGSGATATAVALQSGGGGGAGVATNNYFKGDVGTDDYGGQYEATAINASTGAVSTFTVLNYPSYIAGSAPSNPLTVSGGSGANWTVNATWPSAPVLQLQASGGSTIFGNATTAIAPVSAGTAFTPSVQVLSTGATASFGIGRYSANANGGRIALFKSRGASIGTHGALSSADDMGRFEWYGSDGTDLLAAARISALVDGSVSTGVVPGALVLYTAATGSTPTERMRVRSDGLLQLGSPSWTANGTVATTMTSLGPTGSHTTIQKWLTVKDDAGTTYYIPAY